MHGPVRCFKNWKRRWAQTVYAHFGMIKKRWALSVIWLFRKGNHKKIFYENLGKARFPEEEQESWIEYGDCKRTHLQYHCIRESNHGPYNSSRAWTVASIHTQLKGIYFTKRMLSYIEQHFETVLGSVQLY